MRELAQTWNVDQLAQYDRQAWDGIQKWQNSSRRRRGIIPDGARNGAVQIGQGAARIWKGAPGTSLLAETVRNVLEGGNQAIADAAAASLQRERILEAVRKTGNPAEELADLRSIDLQILDKICPDLNVRYAAASAATGAAAGFVAGGGVAAVAGTGGVAAAPGALVVSAAIAGDVLATLALAARVVTHYAGYYGYDTRKEEEKAVILAVIGVGVAGRGAAKQAAMIHVRQAAMMVARRAAWKELSEEAIVLVVQSIFAKLSLHLTKQKLGQAIPVAGIVIGAGFNYDLMRKVGIAASYAYRERFIIEKYDLDGPDSELNYTDLIDIDDHELTK